MATREIIFRGKRADNGELVISDSLMQVKGQYPRLWVESDVKGWVEVLPETVGQFTGLTDKNGKKIFEGDIVVTRYSNGEICSIGDIQFDYGVFGAEWTINKEHKTMVGTWGQLHNLRRLDDDSINHIEIIGNIYDNPELLEVGV